MTDKDTNNDVPTLVRGLKFDIRDLGKEMTRRFDGVDKTIGSIHSDLIKHDKRANEMLQNLLDLQTLQHTVEKMRQVIREQHGVEI